MSFRGLIEATHLRKSYGARLAIDDLTFSVNSGEVVGLLGPNGAGKTTTLSILATLIAPDAGEVRIAGIDSRVAPDSLRRKLGFVPQSIALYPPLSAFQNLQVFARVHGLTRRLAEARSIEILEAVGLRDRADDPVWTLSGGMKRRLNLACGMVHRPEVLLLDEPTVGVDPQSRERILTTIRALTDSGIAVLYSTHYMEEVERVCDRAFLIDRGKLMAQGTVAQLIELGGRHPRMEIMFETPPRPGWYDGLAGVRELAPATAQTTVALELTNLRQVSELLERAHNAGGQPVEFAVHSPNLSDAFIALTGHALRDGTPEINEDSPMLRAAWIVFQNEFRLLERDRAALFMLALAPLVIITVAGLSLGNIYGAQPGSEPYSLIVVDADHGRLARALVEAFSRDHSVSVVPVANLNEARALVRGRARAPLCIVIPSGTTDAFEAGRDVHLMLYIDPVKRLEAGAIELDLDRLCRDVTTRAHDVARKKMAEQTSHLRDQLAKITDQMKASAAQLDRLRRQFQGVRATAQSEMIVQTRQAIERIRAETILQVDRSFAQTKIAVERDLAARHGALIAVSRYLEQLQASQHDFETWLAKLKSAAGSHASQIPPTPQWPVQPNKAQLAELSKPLDFAAPRIDAAASVAVPKIAIKLPRLPELPDLRSIPDLGYAVSQTASPLPGILGWHERSITGGKAEVNAFDQYVPGFGITFLLVDMLWGVGVGLIDERDWGTLARLRVSGAPASGMMLGKLMSRFLIGLGQMVLLFGAGWALFGISLGRNSWALLFPAAAISFAAAAFSLVIACVANTRDAVLPIGAMAALAMSAIGGCWWPLDFEPHWMRAIALGMPTTWTMEGFNNLMIRGLDPLSTAYPAAITFAIGTVFLAMGILSSSRIYDHSGQ